MAIGTPASIGTNNSTISSNTVTLTTTANILSGDLLVAAVWNYSNQAVSTISDGTNNYLPGVSLGQGGNLLCELWYKQNASAVSSGATLTCTFAGAASTKLLGALRCTGIVTAGALDKTNSSASASTSTPTVTTATLSQASELVIGYVGCLNVPTVTESSGFTTLLNFQGAGGVLLHVGYQVVSSTAAVTYAPTYSVAEQVVDLIATFKGAASGGGLFLPPSLSGIGAGGPFFNRPFGLRSRRSMGRPSVLMRPERHLIIPGWRRAA